MRNPLSKTIEQIKPSGIRKFFDIVSEMPHAISLGVGEPDFDTPWHVRSEGIRSLEKGRTFYTSNSGLIELRQEICKWYQRKYNVLYDYKTEALLTVGGSEGIDVALRAMLDPGDEVIIPEPCYVSYVPCVQLIGAVPVTIELKNENQFRLTPEELLAAITDKTKILILAFPSNPTGAVMTKEDLEPIAKICQEKDIYVISDEIYSELTYGGQKHCSISSLPGMKERTIVINGLRKHTGRAARVFSNANLKQIPYGRRISPPFPISKSLWIRFQLIHSPHAVIPGLRTNCMHWRAKKS